jgi:hypothetical protein
MAWCVDNDRADFDLPFSSVSSLTLMSVVIFPVLALECIQAYNISAITGNKTGNLLRNNFQSSLNISI